MYGTRDAGLVGEECYSSALVDLGFRRGVASPCCFHHAARKISAVIHTDVFTALGSAQGLSWYESKLAEVVDLKVKGRLGDEGCDKEVRVLDWVIRLDAHGLRYEADPRHGETLLQAACIQTVNSSRVASNWPELMAALRPLREVFVESKGGCQ